MTLIYVALLSEGQSIIEKYKLKKISSNPKIYGDEKLLVAIGGIGKENTQKSLEYIYNYYHITKAINIGIAGCSDKNIPIGEIFCTNKILDGIETIVLQTVAIPQTYSQKGTILYDMEGVHFLSISHNYLKKEDIFIFKVVSDHLDDTILPKDQVKKLIHDNLGKIERWI